MKMPYGPEQVPGRYFGEILSLQVVVEPACKFRNSEGQNPPEFHQPFFLQLGQTRTIKLSYGAGIGSRSLSGAEIIVNKLNTRCDFMGANQISLENGTCVKYSFRKWPE